MPVTYGGVWPKGYAIVDGKEVGHWEPEDEVKLLPTKTCVVGGRVANKLLDALGIEWRGKGITKVTLEVVPNGVVTAHIVKNVTMDEFDSVVGILANKEQD